VFSSTPVAVIQVSQPTAEALIDWLGPYRAMPYPVLATLSDGERAIIEALRTCWPKAPYQRCQAHLLNNLVEPVLDYDVELRQRMRQDMGGLPKAPASAGEPSDPDGSPF
jgi:hypothetical protein